MSSFESNIRPIDSLYKQIKYLIDKDIYYKTFKDICDDYDENSQKDLYQNHSEKSLVRKLLQTHERIELTDHLLNSISDDFITKYEYPKLITYLRLTCFDLLGQPSEWLIFTDWIRSKRKRIEREEIIKRITFDNEIEFASKIYQEYHELYSVKNSFFRFLNGILPSDSRDVLLNQIKIRIHEGHESSIKLHEPTQLDKENYLFKIRNDYTHKVYGRAAIHGFRSEHSEKDWHFRETIYKSNFSYWVSTSISFDDNIKEVVYIGISEIIKNYKK